MQITRRLEFDAGHRIPNHQSQCRHLHGHRYAIEITLEGTLQQTSGAADEGMVMDFSLVKLVAYQTVVGKWDHAFLVYSGDRPVMEFLQSMPDHKTVVCDFVPTAENLAAEAFRLLQPEYERAYGGSLRLTRVRLYETPNNWADARPTGA